MPVTTVEITSRASTNSEPIVWRLGKLFNVVTNIRSARVTSSYGVISLDIEGSTAEIDQALNYLQARGLVEGSSVSGASTAINPEDTISQPNTIYVRLSTVTPAQARSPILYRLGKDFNIIVNIQRASVDEKEGGFVELRLSGVLMEVQRAIAFLHTTGMHVDPRERSVTDYSNL